MGLADTRSVSVDAKTASRSSSDIDGDAGERIRVIIVNNIYNWLDCLLLLSYLSLEYERVGGGGGGGTAMTMTTVVRGE